MTSVDDSQLDVIDRLVNAGNFAVSSKKNNQSCLQHIKYCRHHSTLNCYITVFVYSFVFFYLRISQSNQHAAPISRRRSSLHVRRASTSRAVRVRRSTRHQWCGCGGWRQSLRMRAAMKLRYGDITLTCIMVVIHQANIILHRILGSTRTTIFPFFATGL